MKKKKIVITGIVLSVFLATGVVVSANSGFMKDIIGEKSYKQAKQEVKLDNDTTKKFDDVRLKANKNKTADQFKKVEDLPGYVPDDKLKNAEYKTKKLMTYEESYNLGYTDQIIYEIDPDRMVYVLQVKSHDDLEYEGKKIKKPLITNIYDAETGEKISYLWQAEE